jgi:hypothetical protein
VVIETDPRLPDVLSRCGLRSVEIGLRCVREHSGSVGAIGEADQCVQLALSGYVGDWSQSPHQPAEFHSAGPGPDEAGVDRYRNRAAPIGDSPCGRH